MRSPLRALSLLASLLALAAGPATADEAGICGQWAGQVETVRDTGEAQTWASRFSPGDTARGYFMKRGTPARIDTTEVTNPWHQHVNTLEYFVDHNDWALNLNVNGFTLEQDSKVSPPESSTRMRFVATDRDPIAIYGDRRDQILWWTDWVTVSDELEYFPHYTMMVQFVGTQLMLQTPAGSTAGSADLAPALLPPAFGPAAVLDSYGRVSIFSGGGFEGSAQVMFSISNVEQFPCAWVGFDAETGQYGLGGGPAEGEDE